MQSTAKAFNGGTALSSPARKLFVHLRWLFLFALVYTLFLQPPFSGFSINAVALPCQFWNNVLYISFLVLGFSLTLFSSFLTNEMISSIASVIASTSIIFYFLVSFEVWFDGTIIPLLIVSVGLRLSVFYPIRRSPSSRYPPQNPLLRSS